MSELGEVLAFSAQSRDQAEGRVFYPVYGSVTNVNDPQKIGRVKARLDGQGDTEESDWLDPAWPGSMEGTPVKGEQVFVLFAYGDPHRGIYLWHPTTKTKNRAQDFMLLGTTFAGLYADLVAKFNTLQSNYQAFYTFVQGHVHASFGTVSASLIEATIGATAHNNGANTGKPKNADGSVPSANASDTVALSGAAKVK